MRSRTDLLLFRGGIEDARGLSDSSRQRPRGCRLRGVRRPPWRPERACTSHDGHPQSQEQSASSRKITQNLCIGRSYTSPGTVYPKDHKISRSQYSPNTLICCAIKPGGNEMFPSLIFWNNNHYQTSIRRRGSLRHTALAIMPRLCRRAPVPSPG